MIRLFIILLAAVPILLASGIGTARAQSSEAGADVDAEDDGFFGRFIDPYDGNFDFTAGSEGGVAGIVPLGIPGNEPTLGPHLLLAAVYFHAPDPDDEPIPNSPPTMTFGGVGLTENGSSALAGGHSAVWNDGKIRYLGGLATASLNLDYYGTDTANTASAPLAFTIDGVGLVQQAQYRLGSSNFFAGGRYTYLATEVSFELDPGEELALGRSDDSGVTFFVNYDTRDNTFTPNKGTRASVGVSYFSDSLGGDYTYSKFDVSGIQYWQLFDARLSLGLRTEYHYAEGDAPFYALPWVSLRGIPALRYQGSHALTVELEPRWQLTERWGLIGFAGAGRASNDLSTLGEAEGAYNYGVGFRYLLARKLGLSAGLDLARGPEDTTIYVTFGNAWGF